MRCWAAGCLRGHGVQSCSHQRTESRCGRHERNWPVSKEREIALGMVVTKWAADRIVPGIKTLRDTGKNDLLPGESAVAVSPVDGTVLGKVTRTKDKAS